MLYVTSYDSPDLDGVACSVGYCELLNLLGEKSTAVYFGNLGLEVDFVQKYLGFLPIEKHNGSYPVDSTFILVDTADPDAIEPAINPEKVQRIFDHRQLVYTGKFKNAQKHIELVGSCATLITEEFVKHSLTPTNHTSVLLYSAIVSNTINFKNSVTTQRDIDAATWLQKINGLGPDYIKTMFDSKSQITLENIALVINQDFATKSFGDKKIGIAQIEVTDLKKKTNEFDDQIKTILIELKEKNHLDYVFFTGIDILEGKNIFLVYDQASCQFFSKALRISDLQSHHETDSIIMRKQIWPLIEKAFH